MYTHISQENWIRLGIASEVSESLYGCKLYMEQSSGSQNIPWKGLEIPFVDVSIGVLSPVP